MPSKLTKEIVKTMPAPATGTKTIWDSEVTGFGLRIFAPTRQNPAGSRSFFLNYRKDGRERRFKIGAFPDWSVDAARREAKELRRRIDQGDDPATAKREQREAPTVADLAKRYCAEHLPKKAASSQKNDWKMIEKEILPRLGSRKVSEIHTGDIEALHRDVTNRGKPVRANRVMAVASKMFSLALRPMEGEAEPWRDRAQGNPCQGVGRNPEEGHERFFSPAELAALSDAIVFLGSSPARDCLSFIMLTGCRPGEAMLAEWDQFESEPGFWIKPSAHTKQRKAHKVPLGAAAIELLARIKADRDRTPRRASSSYVFPGEIDNKPLTQLRSAWAEITEKASVALLADSNDPKIAGIVAALEQGLKRPPTLSECREIAQRSGIKLFELPADARIYDLRHTFASVGASGGLSLQIIGRLLGHTQARTTQRYAHLADDALREAAAKITAQIVSSKKADVVPLKRGGAA